MGVLALVASLAGGCQPEGTAGDRDKSGDEVTVKLREGNTALVRDKSGAETTVDTAPTGLPAEFPPRFPVYPGARVASIARTEKSVVAILATGDAPDAVFAYYHGRPGFKVGSETRINDSRVLHIEDPKTGRDVMLIANQTASGGFNLSLLVSR